MFDKKLLILVLIVLGVLLALFGFPHQAAAQSQNCGDRAMVIERLSSKYGESRVSIGMAPSSRVVETFANPTSGTWTIVVTTPNGQSCLVASGQSFETFEPAVVPSGIRS